MTCQVCGTSVFKGCDCSKPVSKIEPVFEIGFGWRYGEPLKNGTLLFTEAQLQQAVAEAKASVLGKTPMDIIDEHVAEATAEINELRDVLRRIKDILAEAGHPLCNENGNLIREALKQLVEERDQLADDLGYLNYRCPRHGRFQTDTGPHCPRCDEIDDENRRIPDGADDAARLLDAKDAEIEDLKRQLAESQTALQTLAGVNKENHEALTKFVVAKEALATQLGNTVERAEKAEADSRRLREAVEEVLSWTPAGYQPLNSNDVLIKWTFYMEVHKALRAAIDAAMAKEPK